MEQLHTKYDQMSSLEQWIPWGRRLFRLSVAVWAWPALAGLTLAEVLTAYISPVLGVSIHALLLIGILAATSRSHGATYHFLVALLLLPLIRLLSLTLPLSQYPQVWWYVLIGIPLSLATITAVRVTRLSGSDLGLTWPGRSTPLQLLMGLGGLGLARLAYPILQTRPLVAELSLPEIWLPALGLLLATGVLEELIFRGLLQKTAVAILGRWWTILYVTLAFTAFHLGDQSLPTLLFAFGIGFFFSWFVITTQNLWGVILAHGLSSIGLLLLFPLQH